MPVDRVVYVDRRDFDQDSAWLYAIGCYIEANPREGISWNRAGKMPLRDALYAYLGWEGILGYTDRIMAIVEMGKYDA